MIGDGAETVDSVEFWLATEIEGVNVRAEVVIPMVLMSDVEVDWLVLVLIEDCRLEELCEKT